MEGGQSESWEAIAVQVRGHGDLDQDMDNRYGEKSTGSRY